MSIDTYSEYNQLLQNPLHKIEILKVNINVTAGRANSLWAVTPDAGAIPTIPTACSSSMVGAMYIPYTTGSLRIGSVDISRQLAGCITISDRLCHMAGLSGIITGSITTNLPTAPLPRYTDGVGVMASIDVYTAIGATAGWVSASYTNQDGVSGRLTPFTQLGGTGFNTIHRSITLPLEPGDYGMRSIESIHLSGSTGTAGNYGVTLYKNLTYLPVEVPANIYTINSLLSLGANIPNIEPDACLYMRVFSATSATGVILATIKLI